MRFCLSSPLIYFLIIRTYTFLFIYLPSFTNRRPTKRLHLHGLAWQEMEAKTTTRQTRDGGRWMDHLVGGGGGAEEERRREVAPADCRRGPWEIQQPQEEQ